VHTNLGALLDERDAQVRIALLDADGSSEARRTAADDDDIGLVDIARCIEQLALLVGQLNRGGGRPSFPPSLSLTSITIDPTNHQSKHSYLSQSQSVMGGATSRSALDYFQATAVDVKRVDTPAEMAVRLAAASQATRRDGDGVSGDRRGSVAASKCRTPTAACNSMTAREP